MSTMSEWATPRVFVILEWHDAAMHGSRQMHPEQAAKECPLMQGRAIGWLVAETDVHIILAPDWFLETDDGAPAVRGLRTYPKSGIARAHRYAAEPIPRDAP